MQLTIPRIRDFGVILLFRVFDTDNGKKDTEGQDTIGRISLVLKLGSARMIETISCCSSDGRSTYNHILLQSYKEFLVAVTVNPNGDVASMGPETLNSCTKELSLGFRYRTPTWLVFLSCLFPIVVPFLASHTVSQGILGTKMFRETRCEDG